MNKYLKISIFVAILFLAVFVWYSPILFKGYSFSNFNLSQSLARNIAKTGKFSIENSKNVMLSSEQIAKEGLISSRGDKLSSILSAFIYKEVGIPDQQQAIFISVIINMFVLLFFALTAWKLFDFRKMIVFSLIYIFLPVIWHTTQTPVSYEYSLLFLSLALFFYFGSISKSKVLNYILTGIFLATSFLAKDAMALFAPVFLIWLWFNNKKAILPIFSSLVIIIIAFQVLFAIQTNTSINNNQHLTFFNLASKEAPFSDFGFYGHLYPDPYIDITSRNRILTSKISITMV